jgi:DNA invertase Pin-like site-specific DNA recombinase
MRRVAIYARQDPSPDAQARLDTQIATVAAFVRQRRRWPVATYCDISPGTTLQRPGLAQLISHARAGWFDLVVVERREVVAPDSAARHYVRDQLAGLGVSAVVVRPPTAARLGRLVATLALVDMVEEL